MLRPYKQSERDHIERMVRAAAFALRPALVALRYDYAEDCDGDDCIHFKLVISDDVAYSPQHGGELDFAKTQHMRTVIERIVEPDEYGLLCYFYVRSKREFDSRKDPQWEMEVAA